MADSGAQAALKGYRLQALYTLYRLLEASQEQVFHLEGHEDLDVFSGDGRLLEVIQLKAYDRDLTLSVMTPPKSDSFFRRVLERQIAFPQARELLVSFGPFGEEMIAAWVGSGPARGTVIQKFVAWGYTAQQAERLLDSVKLQNESERDLEAGVMQALRASVAGYDPEAAFTLLHGWLYRVAEAHGRLGRQELMNRLAAVSRFLAERATHHTEWFTTIVPLLSETPEMDVATLRAEFDQGISARYVHILAGVDVVRPEIMLEIEEAFSASNTVIVRGASGQGKSTLAYRYLHDSVPEVWRFEVRPLTDQRQALNVARALLGHLSAVGSIAYIYIDVLPGDATWTALVQELQAHPDARLLVTIREEDWVRTAVDRAWKRPAEVELSFGPAEARILYDRLTAERPLVHALDFGDLWNRFGGAGPLLEFTYLVTQDSTLESRLQGQVNRLKDEVRRGERAAGELELLRRVAVASAYGARLDFPLVALALGLPEPRRTVELLEREYLLRTDAQGRLLDGLHPVRSVILIRLLTDDLFNPWGAVASRSLSQILEQDWETFLLHAFSRHPSNRLEILRAMLELRPTSWEGAALVSRALLWLGVREYVEQNIEVITEVQEVNGGWGAVLMADVGHVDGVVPGLVRPFWQELNLVPEEQRARLTAFRARLTPNAEVLSHIREWLTRLAGPLRAPQTSSAWSAVAELIYWAGRLNLELRGIEALINEFSAASSGLDLDAIADVSYATSFVQDGALSQTLERLRPVWLSRFRHEANGIVLEDDGRRVALHFLFAPDLIPAEAKPGNRSKNWIHEETLWRIDLLHRLRPGRTTYAIQGYGHQIGAFAVPHDDTHKEIPSRSLPPLWSTALNGRYYNLGNYPERPATWADFAERTWHLRREVLLRLSEFSTAIETFFRRRGTTPFLASDGLINGTVWDFTIKAVGRPPQLPQVAVDEWGFVSESSAASSQSPSTERDTPVEGHSVDAQRSLGALGLCRHRPYLEVSRTFFNSLDNFFRQVIPVLIVRPYTHRIHSAAINILVAQQMIEQGWTEQEVDGHLPTHNFLEALRALPVFQETFRRQYGSRWSTQELQVLERQEHQVYQQALNLWLFFLDHTRRVGIGRPSLEAEKTYGAILARFKRSLGKALDTLEPLGIRAKVLRTSAAWEGSSALWIAFDIDDPVELYHSFEKVMEVLYSSLPRGDDQQRAQQLVTLQWPNIHVVPTVQGKALQPVSWRNSSLVLMTTMREDLGWWNIVPLPLPPETWSELQLKLWSQPRLEWMLSWQRAYVSVLMLVGHVRSLSGMPDPDALGVSLLETYTGTVGTLLSRQMQALIDASSRIADYTTGQAGERGVLRPHLQSAIDLFLSVWEILKDLDLIADHQAWTFEKIITLYHPLEQLLGTIESLRLLWSRDVLNHDLEVIF